MRDTRATAEDLRATIERTGYYPGLVTDAVASALGSEPVMAYVVHHDAIFTPPWKCAVTSRCLCSPRAG